MLIQDVGLEVDWFGPFVGKKLDKAWVGFEGKYESRVVRPDSRCCNLIAEMFDVVADCQ